MAENHPNTARDPLVWCIFATIVFWGLCLLRITIPSAPYFDEVHYVPAAKDILAQGIFSNREHPLFAKELLAVSIYLFGDAPLGWRILPSIAGALTLFAAMRTLWIATRSRFATLSYGLLVATGFHLFIHARIAMLDVFFVCFLTIAAWQFAAAIRRPEQGRWRLAITGIAIGLSMASKWNAIPYAVLPGLAFFAYRLSAGRRRLLLSVRGAPVPGISLLEAALWLGIVPLAVYLLTFIPGFFFAQQPMTGIIAHHQTMLELQTQVLKEHPYQSVWSDWIINNRAIWYLYEEIDGAQRGVLLIGNPLTMLLGLPALAWTAWRAATRRDPASIAITVLYAVGLGFWIVAAKPIQFYYHYFFPSMVLLAALAMVMDEFWQSGRKWLAVAPVVGSAAIFAYFYPILSAAELDGPMAFLKWSWLESWR